MSAGRCASRSPHTRRAACARDAPSSATRAAASRHAPRAATSGAGPGERSSSSPCSSSSPPSSGRRRWPPGRPGRARRWARASAARSRGPICLVGAAPSACAADRVPCVVSTRRTATDAHVDLLVLRLGGGRAVLREARSDGTVAVDAARPPRRRPAGRRGHAGRGLGRPPQLRARRRGQRGGGRARRARAHLDLPVGGGGRRLPARPRWARSGSVAPGAGARAPDPPPAATYRELAFDVELRAAGQGARGRRRRCALGRGRHLGRASRRRRLAHGLRPPATAASPARCGSRRPPRRPRRRRPRTTPCALGRDGTPAELVVTTSGRLRARRRAARRGPPRRRRPARHGPPALRGRVAAGARHARAPRARGGVPGPGARAAPGARRARSTSPPRCAASSTTGARRRSAPTPTTRRAGARRPAPAPGCASGAASPASSPGRAWSTPPRAGRTARGSGAATAWAPHGVRIVWPGASILPGCEHVFASMDYVELHCHSAFSFLDGASLPEELVAAAVERGHEALALTDHDSLSGSMEHAQAAKALGLRAIHGAEVTVVAGPPGSAPAHAAAQARTRRRPRPPAPGTSRCSCATSAGWRNLCRLLTQAHAHTRDRLSRRVLGHPLVTLDDVGRPRRGARLPERLRPPGRARPAPDAPAAARLRPRRPARRAPAPLRPPRPRAEPRAGRRWPPRLGVPCVATGDVHAHAPERALVQDAFVAIREHTTLDASEPLRRGNHSHVLATPAAMAARFADHPDAVAETARLAAALRFDLTSDLGYRYPGAEDDAGRRDAGGDLPRALRRALSARAPAARRGGGPPGRGAAAHRRASACRASSSCTTTCSSSRARWRSRCGGRARRARCCRRGAGAGPASPRSSATSPASRTSTPSPTSSSSGASSTTRSPRCRTSTSTSRATCARSSSRASTSATAATTRRSSPPSRPTAPRGAIRELGKALGLPPGEIERVARGSEGFGAFKVDERRELRAGRRAATAEGRWGWLVRLADEAHGLPRHLSQHSGGMIVSTRPLIDCCPVVPAAMEGRQMVMWDKDSCADAGFLKIDLLGLGMLSAVERCVEAIARAARRAHRPLAHPLRRPGGLRRHPERPRPRASSRSRAARRWRRCCARGPRTLDDLTIQVAIVRPGPIQGGAVNPYIERRQRLREDPSYVVPYDHPSLEPVLRDTLGTIIFQDQVIEVAMAFAGFSPGRGRGPAPGDEPQALGGGDRRLPRPLRRGRCAAHARRRRGARRARLHDDRRLLGLRVPQGPRRRLRPAGLPVDVAAGALRARSSSPRCSTSSPWASTRPTPWSTRPSAAA